MRTINNDLFDAQSVRTPRARVTCTFSARGQNPEFPALVWSELVSNAEQTVFAAVTACGLDDGAILRFVSTGAAVDQQTITSPTLATSWTSPAATTQVIASGVSDMHAVHAGSGTVRLFYIVSGNVYYIETADSGENWGSPVTIYSGGDAAEDLVAAYIGDGTVTFGPWFVGFSTLNMGTYAAYFGYDNSGWSFHKYADNWRAGGIDPNYATTTSTHQVLMLRQHSNGTARIRTADKITTYANDADIDEVQAGLFGLQIVGYRLCQLTELGVSAAVVVEGAQGGRYYVGVSGFWWNQAYLMDEPVMLPGMAAVNNAKYFTLCTDGANVYLVADVGVQMGVPQPASGQTLIPIRYRYDDHEIEMEFEPGIDTLYVGNLMQVHRTISWGSKTGTESVSFYIVRVEEGTDRVTVTAVDAVGYLGIARCRRPYIANDGTKFVGDVMRRVAARFGLDVHVDDSGLNSAGVMPLTVQPAESLLGVAYRAASQSNFWLVPSNDGTFAVTVIDPPNSSVSGDYDDTAHTYPLGGALGGQELIRATHITDYRRLAFAYILGTRSTDPEDGAAVAMAAGPVVENTRPFSYSLTNTRYNTDDRVQAAAAAEATRQKKLNVNAVIESWANLALEKYDIVEVTESRLGWSSKRFRVRRVVEQWKNHRLTQTIYLGEEN